MSHRLMTGVLLAALIAGGCRPEAQEIRTRAPSSQTFNVAVEQVLPAVVFVQVEARAMPMGDFIMPTQPVPPRSLPPDLPPGFPEIPPDHPGPEPRQGSGSGVIFRRDGYILTSDHVIQQAHRVRVTLHDRRQFEARVVARDPSTDVAVLKVEGTDLPVASLGNSDDLALGDWILALGSPLGLQFSVTAGVVSAIGRAIGILDSATDGQMRTAPLEHFIQTDAAINPGNSGGPLVNLAGEVVGINTAIASPTGFFAGYGFAVPINLARRVADDLIRHGVVRRGYLGVMLSPVDAADAIVYDLPSAQGAEVVSVERGGPADRAGLEIGDVIVRIDEIEVGTVGDLQAAVAALDPGTTATLHVIRYGSRLDLPATLGLIESGIVPDPPAPDEGPARVGFAVAAENGRVRVAAVRPYSAAARAGIRPGQVILAVNRREIRSVEEFLSTLQRIDRPAISLLVLDPRLGRTIINYELRGTDR